MDQRPDELPVTTAAALIGVTPEMVRRIARQGFIEIHRRGYTTIRSVVAGYARFIIADAQTGEAAQAASRSHAAKAAKVRTATARRLAGLADTADTALLVERIADIAASALAAMVFPSGLPPATVAALRAAVADAVQRISDAAHEIVAGVRIGMSFNG